MLFESDKIASWPEPPCRLSHADKQIDHLYLYAWTQITSLIADLASIRASLGWINLDAS